MKRARHDRARPRATASSRRRPEQMVRQAARLPRRLIFPLPGRGDRRGGESGSGKTTLLQLLSMQLAPSRGRVRYCMRDGATRDLASLGEAERRFLFRTDWGYVHQDPALGLRMAVSAGANVGERLMAVGWN